MLIKLDVSVLINELCSCTTPTSIDYGPVVTPHMNPPDHSDNSIDVYDIRACACHLSAIECHYRVLRQHHVKSSGVAWCNTCE
jgi:hypothetical protein